MPRLLRSLAAGLVVAAAVGALPTPAPAEPASRWAQAAATMELAAQTPLGTPGSAFAMRLRLDGVPDDGSLTIVVHQRVRSRSELAQSMEGEGLRNRVFDIVTPLPSIPPLADGTRRLTLSLDAATGGLPLQAEGVYPVEVIAKDAAGTELTQLVTHLIVPPAAGDDAPSLGVAVVAQVGAPPALQPDGNMVLPPADLEAIAQIVTGLVTTAAVPASLAVTPETIDALAASPDPAGAELLQGLRTAAAGRTVLGRPYVAVSPDDLTPAGLLGELAEERARGREVLTDALGATPTDTAWIAPSDLGAAGMDALAATGVEQVVVADTQVTPLETGLIRYSLAQPFRLREPADTPTAEIPSGELQALALDPVVLERLATEGSPGLVASRVLSELALLRLEQPSVARSVVLPMATGLSAEVVELVLSGLGAGRPFAPMSLGEAFSHAAPLVDGGGNAVSRRLLPGASTPVRNVEAQALTEARSHLDTFVGLVGPDSPLPEPLDRHLLVALASGLTASERRGHIAFVEAAIDDVTSTVTTPPTFTLTLTAREGTIPLTIHNGSGVPLHVSIRMRSQKLEFPDGDRLDQVLTEETTRIDLEVRSRASGAFLLEVDVMTPDGQRSLAMTRYTVRSTAVSGAGLVLSIGAGLFLVVWWARHWRRARRSARLIAGDGHPAASRPGSPAE